jgi:hypothetical protein
MQKVYHLIKLRDFKLCSKRFIDKDKRYEGVILEIWVKYPKTNEFVKVQSVEDKNDWYRSPPDYQNDEIITMKNVHETFQDGESITWGSPLAMIIKGGGSNQNPHTLQYKFHDVKIWRPEYN